MVYQVSLKKRVLKALEDINEPYYSKIKEAIYRLADNSRPQGYKKLKGREGYRGSTFKFKSSLRLSPVRNALNKAAGEV